MVRLHRSLGCWLTVRCVMRGFVSCESQLTRRHIVVEVRVAWGDVCKAACRHQLPYVSY